jgi:hypothetical protein
MPLTNAERQAAQRRRTETRMTELRLALNIAVRQLSRSEKCEICARPDPKVRKALDEISDLIGGDDFVSMLGVDYVRTVAGRQQALDELLPHTLPTDAPGAWIRAAIEAENGSR